MSLLMMLLFLVVAVVGRVLLQYKLTGDHGIRSAKRTASGMEKFTAFLVFLAMFGFTAISALPFFAGVVWLSVLVLLAKFLV